MKLKFIENLLDKITEYLPDEEPATEQERLYEEGKKRIYEMHQQEKNLFYADEAWIRQGKARVYGEIANGSFKAGDQAVLLDVQGKPLLEGEILGIEKVSDGQEETNQDAKRYYLFFDSLQMKAEEDFFVQTYYVIKKH